MNPSLVIITISRWRRKESITTVCKRISQEIWRQFRKSLQPEGTRKWNVLICSKKCVSLLARTNESHRAHLIKEGRYIWGRIIRQFCVCETRYKENSFLHPRAVSALMRWDGIKTRRQLFCPTLLTIDDFA